MGQGRGFFGLGEQYVGSLERYEEVHFVRTANVPALSKAMLQVSVDYHRMSNFAKVRADLAGTVRMMYHSAGRSIHVLSLSLLPFEPRRVSDWRSDSIIILLIVVIVIIEINSSNSKKKF